MNRLEKKEKLELIVELCKKHNITAYEIGKNTNLTNAGAHKIITLESKNPHTSTLNTILNYIEEKLSGEYKPNTKENFVNEDEGIYNFDLEEIITRRVERRLQHKFDNLQKQINDFNKTH